MSIGFEILTQYRRVTDRRAEMLAIMQRVALRRAVKTIE